MSHRLVARNLLRNATARRAVVQSPMSRAQSGSSTTQGHTTQKQADPMHKGADVQSAAARSGLKNQDDSQSSSGEAGQPHDAARQGGPGGLGKSAEGTGSFKDQVGGQPSGGPAGHKGGQEATDSQTLTGKVSDALSGRNPKRQFSTTSTPRNGTSPRADPDGAREPHDKGVQGDQNAHLKHTEGGSQGPQNGGNAAPEPHLPSHSQTGSSSSAHQKPSGTSPFGSAPGAQQSRKIHSPPFEGSKGSDKYAGTHAPEPAKSGYDAPPEPLPSDLKSSYPDIDSSAHPAPQTNATPSSKVTRSSTATDPAHETLSKAAKEGNLADRNPQPQADMGPKGVEDAWKDRKA